MAGREVGGLSLECGALVPADEVLSDEPVIRMVYTVSIGVRHDDIIHALGILGQCIELLYPVHGHAVGDDGLLCIPALRDEACHQGDVLIERCIVASESLRDQHRTEQQENPHQQRRATQHQKLLERKLFSDGTIHSSGSFFRHLHKHAGGHDTGLFSYVKYTVF